MDQLKNIPDITEAIIRALLPPEIRNAIPEVCASCHKKFGHLSQCAETWPARKPDTRCENCRASYRGRGRGMSRRARDEWGVRDGRGGHGCMRDETCSNRVEYGFEIRGHCHGCFKAQ